MNRAADTLWSSQCAHRPAPPNLWAVPVTELPTVDRRAPPPLAPDQTTRLTAAPPGSETLPLTTMKHRAFSRGVCQRIPESNLTVIVVNSRSRTSNEIG